MFLKDIRRVENLLYVIFMDEVNRLALKKPIQTFKFKVGLGFI